MMEIRLTELKDLPLVMEIYDYARAFMRANGAGNGTGSAASMSWLNQHTAKMTPI